MVAQLTLGANATSMPGRLPIVHRSDAGWSAPLVPVVSVPPVLLARDLFASHQASSGSPVAAVAPLGGAVVVGSVRVGRRLYAVVQAPTGASGRLPLGGTLRGWRLSRLDDDGAHFTRGPERLDIAFGASPIPIDPANQQSDSTP